MGGNVFENLLGTTVHGNTILTNIFRSLVDVAVRCVGTIDVVPLPPTPPAPTPYAANAVHFDGSTTLGLSDRGAGLATNSATGLLSVWVKGTNFLNFTDRYLDANFSALFGDFNKGDVAVTSAGVNILAIQFYDAAETDYCYFTAPAFAGTDWMWIGLSWDTNFAAGSRIVQCYFGDTSQGLATVYDNGAAFVSNYSDFGWYLGAGPYWAASDGLGITGDEADFQMWCGNTFLDLTIEANRRLFIDANGKPVDPAVAAAALGAQTVLLSGNAAQFPTNQGDGGATSVLAGTLTDAASSPSD